MEPIDGHELLDKIAALPVATWRYEWEPEGVVHVGPMAQDFKEMFGLGDDDRVIATVDAIGVLFVGVQALYRQTKKLEAQLDGRRSEAAEDFRGCASRDHREAAHDHAPGGADAGGA